LCLKFVYRWNTDLIMARSRPVRLFLSYVRDTYPFVKSFISAFLSTEGNKFEPLNWLNEGVPAGNILEKDLQEQIEKSEIFVAVICQDYEHRIAAKELQWAIDLWNRRAGQLRIIPLILNRSGLDYWERVTADTPGLAQVTYQSFYDVDNPNKWICPDDDRADLIQDVYALRKEAIRQFFNDNSALNGDSANHVPVQQQGSVPAELETVPQAVVLLGRPTGVKLDPALDGAVQQASTDAVTALRNAGITVETWPDRWRTSEVEQPLPKCDAGAPADAAVFVQPLSPVLAEKYLDQPNCLENDITWMLPREAKNVIAASKLVYWMPHGQVHDGFNAKAITDSEANPAFRIDDPVTLAAWIGRMLEQDGPNPVVAYQDIEDPETTDGGGQFYRSELQELLREEVKSLVEPVLPEDDDDKELHPFSFGRNDPAKPDKALEKTLQMLARRRPILIAHNLNNSGNGVLKRGSPRRQIIQTFRNVQEKADRVLEARGVTKEKVFWLGFLTQGHDLLPDTAKRLPVCSVDRWRILELTQTKNGLSIEKSARRDDVLEELCAWARTPNGR
jgi:hypothetical protein